MSGFGWVSIHNFNNSKIRLALITLQSNNQTNFNGFFEIYPKNNQIKYNLYMGILVSNFQNNKKLGKLKGWIN